jgi:hypothetical protein
MSCGVGYLSSLPAVYHAGWDALRCCGPRSRASIVASNEILLGKLTAAFANKDGEYVEVGEVR